ncbi:uncharacterized protein LOC105696593 [Orussus abietinus]|uniref:uncharacterized protein LOC105696593 n=1 Tax=Orussus abietinus TaxID=222816 RepID=UPI0006256AB2|nr:uncharacterized protein LOC105696593 [Orussus abietinus]
MENVFYKWNDIDQVIMHGIKRVVIFCILTTVLPMLLLAIPLYLRHSLYADVAYAVTESDILEVQDGISTIFCSKHTLQMNETFNAFQMKHRPEIASYRKHIRLKKSMTLPDDTLEYWGFYLLKGATVALSVCSRFEGASILVVKGERNLRTCGMLEHNENKARAKGIFLPEANKQMKVESIAQSKTSHKVNEISLSTTQNINLNNLHTSQVDAFNKSKHPEEINSLRESFRTLSDLNYSNTNSRPVEDEVQHLYRTAETYVRKHIREETPKKQLQEKRKLRHARQRLRTIKMDKGKKEKERYNYKYALRKSLHKEQNHKKVHRSIRQSQPMLEMKIKKLSELLETDRNLNVEAEENEEIEKKDVFQDIQRNQFRKKRNQAPIKEPALLDQGVKHGGNAIRNLTETDEESSVSSFENGLLNCYEGQVLLAREFDPNKLCTNVSYLESGRHMQTRHEVAEDGYYYYIFYSDNDFVSNDIHAVFDIYKPTFQYENVTRSCINVTHCSFSLDLLSSNRVIVELPTKDGIEQIEDDIALLVSTCQPRMSMYIIFPISVLFLVLGCAFL